MKVLGPQSSGYVCIGYCHKLLAWYQIQSVQKDGCFGAKEGGRAWEQGYLPVGLHDALTSFPRLSLSRRACMGTRLVTVHNLPQSCRYSNHWSCIFKRGHTCMYHHYLADNHSNHRTSVRESPQEHHIFEMRLWWLPRRCSENNLWVVTFDLGSGSLCN